MDKQEFLSISDFFVILFKRKLVFVLVWLSILALAITYLALTDKSYQLSGTLYVGRFQEILIEEGEFVANKLTDYSFIKRALDNANIQLDIPVARFQQQVEAEVVNEIKKIRDVGLVRLTVEYKDREMVHAIFKALTDQLILDHGVLLKNSADVFKDMEAQFREREAALRASMAVDEQFLRERTTKQRSNDTVPSQLLSSHTLSEKAEALKLLIKDIHYIKIEGDSATKSYNTKLAAEPAIPDHHHKPKKALVLILAAIVATIAATLSALSLHLYATEIRPKLAA